MGLLAYSPYGYDPLNPMLRNVTPFAQPQAPEGQGQGPQGFAPAPPQQPQQQQPNNMQSAWRGLLGTSNLQPGASYADRFNAIAEGPLFNAGLGLIAASAPGADGRDFANYMQNYQQQRTQREQLRRQNAREDVADRRAATQFGWAEDAQRRATDRRGRVDTWARTQQDNPMATVDPEATFEAEAAARAAANQPITPYQQAQLASDRRGQDLSYGAAIARMNVERPLRGPDASLLTDVRDAAARGQALSMLGDEFLAANAQNPTGELSPYNPLNFVSADRAAMRAASSRMRGYMRPPGSGATSDFEQRLYAMGAPATTNTGPQNQAIVAGHRAQAALAQARMNFYEAWAYQNGNLYGAEQAFQQSSDFQRIRGDFTARYGEVARPQAEARPQQRSEAAPASGQITPAQARAELERRERERRQRGAYGNQPGGYTGR